MRLGAAAVFLLAWGVLPPAAAAPGAGGKARAEQESALREMEVRFARAVAAKDLKAFQEFWAEDASIFPPDGTIVTGRQKIAESWSSLLNDPQASLSWEPARVEVSASGDLGYTYGRYQSQRVGRDGLPIRRTGRYVTIWRREAEGRWRIVVDIGSPDPPPDKAAP